MSLDGQFYKAITGIFSSTSAPQKFGSDYFIPFGYAESIFGEGDYIKDFLEIPELNAVLNIRARARTMGIRKIVSKETGLEVKNNQSLIRMLKNPNWFQGEDEFIRQASLYRDIYGNEYTYYLTPVGMPGTYLGKFTLNPADVDIEYNKDEAHYLTPTDEAVKYTYNLNGKKSLINKSDLIHLNDNRVESKNILKGTSKLASLQPNLKNIRAAYMKRNIVLNAPAFIMSNGNTSDAIGQSIPLDPEEKSKLQLMLKQRGALPIVTNMAVRIDDININASNMGLFEEVERDLIIVCDVFGVPFELLGSLKGNRFASNQNTAEKWFYENTVIPDSKESISAENHFFEKRSGGKLSWEIRETFDHLPIFQENIKERSQSLNTLTMALNRAFTDGAITIQQYQNELQKFKI